MKARASEAESAAFQTQLDTLRTQLAQAIDGHGVELANLKLAHAEALSLAREEGMRLAKSKAELAEKVAVLEQHLHVDMAQRGAAEQERDVGRCG